MSLNPLSPFPLKALPLVRLCVAASRAHHPERRPGDCDEARDHPGVRPAPRAAGEGRQRLRLLRTGRQVAGRRRSYGEDRRRHRKDNVQSAILTMEYIFRFPNFFFIMYYICT